MSDPTPFIPSLISDPPTSQAGRTWLCNLDVVRLLRDPTERYEQTNKYQVKHIKSVVTGFLGFFLREKGVQWLDQSFRYNPH